MTFDYVSSIFKIILFDLVLSGDNAVVIGMAAHVLPPRQRRQAMLWGCGMAIALRVLLTLVVAQLLLFPGLRFLGALMLAWIACKLLLEEGQKADETRPPAGSLFRAIRRIAMADFIMSLDNVVAIAGASGSDPVRIVLGLFLSISILLVLSAAVMEIMNRHPWIAYLGTGVLAVTAADLMVQDLEAFAQAGLAAADVHALPAWAIWAFRAGISLVCLTTRLWWPRSMPEETTSRESPMKARASVRPHAIGEGQGATRVGLP